MESQAGSLRVAVSNNLVPVCRLDVGRVIERAPWQLRERPTVVVIALRLHLKATLLRHGSVPASIAMSDLQGSE